jgi:hypothetical protein
VPWQNVSGGDHQERQLTGTPSLGVLYNDQLSTWNEVLYPFVSLLIKNFVESPVNQRIPAPEQVDWRRLLDRTMSCNWNVPYISHLKKEIVG